MLTIKKLTPGESAIIQAICESRIKSFIDISQSEDLLNDSKAMGLDISIHEINYSISSFIEIFDNLRINPHKAISLESISYSLLKHSLLHMEVNFSGGLEKDRRNLWKKIICRDNLEKIIFLN